MTHPTDPVNLDLDLDGVIDESPRFFAMLAKVWPGRVIVISYRSDRGKAEADLKTHGVEYDERQLAKEKP